MSWNDWPLTVDSNKHKKVVGKLKSSGKLYIFLNKQREVHFRWFRITKEKYIVGNQYYSCWVLHMKPNINKQLQYNNCNSNQI